MKAFKIIQTVLPLQVPCCVIITFHITGTEKVYSMQLDNSPCEAEEIM